MMPRLSTTTWIVGLLLISGCYSPLMRWQSPESDNVALLAEEDNEEGVELVGDTTIPLGLDYRKIEGVSLVNGLNGTGGDSGPSSLRSSLISEMQSYDVRNPQQLLQSPTVSLVVVRGWLPPGVEQGDSFDVEVVVPPKSKTTSLRQGYLLKGRMREIRVLDNAVHSGHVAGLAQGPVIVDSIFGGTDDEVLETRGRILGGGQSQLTRPLGLGIRGNSTVRHAAAIGAAINSRFHKTDRNGQSGVARPKRDNYIELAVHPRYKNNIHRYVRVVRSIALKESPGERVLRTESLERRLLEPTTSARAALQLEAIGEDAAHILLKGLESSSPEVRFYSAEALAYLDREEAAKTLGWAAANISAFRWYALTALATMDHVAAYEALNELLHVPSAETRYGAFRALRSRNAADPLVRGESLGGGFAFHVISSEAAPMIHVSKSQRPEIVLFGQHQKVVPPAFLFAGKEIMIKGTEDGRLRLIRFTTGDQEDPQETCDAEVDPMIRAIVRLGGGYCEVVQALREARQGGYLDAKVVVNAMARPNRTYHGDDASEATSPDEPPIRVANPVPELFVDRLETDGETADTMPRYEPEEVSETPAEDSDTSSFMGRMRNWFAK